MHRIIYNKNIVIAEQTPCTRTITVWEKRFRLSFPYMVFVYTGDFYAFANTRPIRYIDDIVARLPLPNVYVDGKVCLGEFLWNLHFHSLPREAVAVKAASAFFQMPFVEGALRKGYWYGKAATQWKKASHFSEVNWKPARRLCDLVNLRAYGVPHDLYADEVNRRAKAVSKNPDKALLEKVSQEITQELYKDALPPLKKSPNITPEWFFS